MVEPTFHIVTPLAHHGNLELIVFFYYYYNVRAVRIDLLSVALA